ncbi:MAG: permease [Gammaproteobacteria bacterium RIFCSPHIGHO2_12_FULL_41_20]|nr:MAG: permease [Gammaproteobacteria bacterium RIFCSPHIGHO2_12_FULL_41_20]
MTILLFSCLLFLVSILAGLLGALTGLGGGVVIIPALVLFFDINIRYAMGAALISVIATSSGAAVAYLREGYTNLRIGMFLETGAVVGAFIGAVLVAFVSTRFIAIVFAVILFLSAYLTVRRKHAQQTQVSSHPWAVRLQLTGDYPTTSGMRTYSVQHVPAALVIMTIAGIFSGLLGIGSGALKVLAMDQALRLPYKVATTTSNFIIGITASVSVGIYFFRGYVDPNITFPVVLGVAIGSIGGAKLLSHIKSRSLRIIFSVVICLLGAQMLYKGMTGALS